MKNNPLNPKLRQVAGDCLDEKQCKQCAVNVLRYMKQQAADEDRRIQEAQRRKREEELKRKIEEEEEQKRLREIKKMEKELKKQELQKRKQAEKEEKNLKNDSEKENLLNEQEEKAASEKNERKKPFILRLLNTIFVISFLLFIVFILFSVYCDKFTNYKLFEAKSQFAKYGSQIQKNLNQICFKYDFQFKYLVNHFKKQFNL